MIAITTTTDGSATEDAGDIIENLKQDTMGALWRMALNTKFTKPYFRKVTIQRFCTHLQKSADTFPAA